MHAGKELDALIVERVMGWRLDVNLEEMGLIYVAPDGSHRLPDEVPPYSTNIEAAWEVVEMAQKGGLFKLVFWDWGSLGRNWYSEISLRKNVKATAHADTAPLAICLAALEAVGN